MQQTLDQSSKTMTRGLALRALCVSVAVWVTLSACVVDAEKRPSFQYEPASVDTVGVRVSYEVISEGGAVTRYAVDPALPAGLRLDSGTGRIFGVPSAPSASAVYTITGKGPGGSSKAALTLNVVPMPPPRIAYDSLFASDEDQDVSHAVTSTGGRVTKYSIQPPLPYNMYLDAQRGSIAGTAHEPLDTTLFRVIAEGPGGADTAFFRMTVKPRPTALRLGVKFGYARGYTLSRIAISLTPDGGGSPYSDTVPATELGDPDNLGARRFFKFIPIPAGDWTVLVRALDPRDSVVHEARARVEDLAFREWRDVDLETLSRFVSRVVEFGFPDSLRVLDGPVSAIRFRRVRFIIGASDTLDLRPASGEFFSPQPSLHKFRLHYLPRFSEPDIRMEYYGEYAGWDAARPLYRETYFRFDASFGSGSPLAPRWAGPGSSEDPSRNPNVDPPQVNRPYAYIREFGESTNDAWMQAVPPY